MRIDDALNNHLPAIGTRTRQAMAMLKADSRTGLESALTFARDHLRQIQEGAKDQAGRLNDAAVSCVCDQLSARIDHATARLREMPH